MRRGKRHAKRGIWGSKMWRFAIFGGFADVEPFDATADEFCGKCCHYPPLTKWGADDIVLPSVCVYVRSITSPIFKI